MYRKLDEGTLTTAYKGREDLQDAIRNAATAGPQYVELFNCISTHILSLLPPHSSDQDLSKKRKLEKSLGIETSHNKSSQLQQESENLKEKENILLEIENISFILPQRKKLAFRFTDQYCCALSSQEQVAGSKLAWKDIKYAFLLPIPEKTQAQHGFLLFPCDSCCLLPSRSNPSATASSSQQGPIAFMVPSAGAPKLNSIKGSLSQEISAVSDDYVNLFSWALKKCSNAAGKSIDIICTDEKLFFSSQRQFHRPNEKAVWVKAFRGSTEGYLFFLNCGILWAFRKPVLFLSHSKICAVSFTSVLSRTFNLNIEIFLDDTESQSNEIEFTMLDQEDFENIKRYVNRHGLQDRSMADKRKAKILNVTATTNNDPSTDVNRRPDNNFNNEVAPENQETLDDDDDDEEEDYDPGSEGQSEGSGSSSSSDEEEN
ncbi:putative negative regulator of dna transposition protein [Erysiphe necator]|uniref:Putative negative regulator of dna transposition protein n=1 Tax=Uncinula necator TaxID=52586 RepID=A0A0B1P2H8_UNCNE|nr:putative negative regulator of dna transposition protein [Erysiphe necator]